MVLIQKGEMILQQMEIKSEQVGVFHLTSFPGKVGWLNQQVDLKDWGLQGGPLKTPQKWARTLFDMVYFINVHYKNAVSNTNLTNEKKKQLTKIASTG